MSHVIDFRVRLPLELRPAEDLPADYLDQYDKVLDLSANRHRTVADLLADMEASGTTHAVVHAEYEYGDDADALNEAVGKLVSEQPDKFSGYGTISMSPVKIPRALAQVRRVAELGLTGLSLQPSFFGMAIDDRVLYPVYAKADELGLHVALHTGINYTVSFPIRNDQPIQLDQVACDFPGLVLIACHAGLALGGRDGGGAAQAPQRLCRVRRPGSPVRVRAEHRLGGHEAVHEQPAQPAGTARHRLAGVPDGQSAGPVARGRPARPRARGAHRRERGPAARPRVAGRPLTAATGPAGEVADRRLSWLRT